MDMIFREKLFQFRINDGLWFKRIFFQIPNSAFPSAYVSTSNSPTIFGNDFLKMPSIESDIPCIANVKSYQKNHSDPNIFSTKKISVDKNELLDKQRVLHAIPQSDGGNCTEVEFENQRSGSLNGGKQ